MSVEPPQLHHPIPELDDIAAGARDAIDTGA